MKNFNNDINLSVIREIISVTQKPLGDIVFPDVVDLADLTSTDTTQHPKTRKTLTISIDDNTLIEGKYNNSFSNVAELSEANEQSICFYENEIYLNYFQKSKAGLIFIPENSDFIPNENQIYFKVQKPYLAFMTLVTWWLKEEEKHLTKKVSPLASIHETATVGKNVHIAPFVVLEENVIIEDNTYIGAHTVIMKDSKVGQNSKIYPNVVIYENCCIGNNVILHSGAVIGADGFGFIEIGGTQVKIPQVGNVIIDDDVEIGACSCIDRSTIGTTLIKTNAKIDNLVQVGHNCKIGEHTVLCAQVGLAGGTITGKNVYLAGQVGVAGHLTIEDKTMVGAQSGVASSLSTGKYFGYPALPAFEQKKIMASLKEIPAVVRFVKKQMSG
jgi:UDP-3-O-[3-hydroxymyristoyl] glucosamine N-acyltransferase